MPKTPICVIAFKRPELTRIVLDTLSVNFDIQDAPLRVYIDAARNKEEAPLVEQVADLCESYDWKGDKKIIRNDENRGLRSAVIAAISDCLSVHSQVCVVEDDVVTSPFFYRFMCKALETYKDSAKVSSICGAVNFLKGKRADVEPFFARHYSCWGWATWKHVWDAISWDDAESFSTIKKSRRKREFNYGIQPPFYNFLSAVAAKTLDSWAISFGASSFLADQYCYYPPQSLTLNIGWAADMGGAHPSTHDPNALMDFRDFSGQIQRVPDSQICEQDSLRKEIIKGMRKNHTLLFLLRQSLLIPYRLKRKIRTILTKNR